MHIIARNLLAALAILYSSSLVKITAATPATIKRSTGSLLSTYDYIIAGGGTAGLTIADRLTAAFPDRNVLVVEFGQLVNTTEILTPAATVPNRNYAFQILSQPEQGLNNRSFTVTVGKIVGGCSAINAQMFDRGSKADYDAWGEIAGTEYTTAGWSWDGLLPYFRKSTIFTRPSAVDVEKYGYTYDVEAAYGGSGGIHASYPPFQWPSEKVMRNAWKELGAPTPKEGAGGNAVGVFWLPSSQDPGTQTRSYARTGHYDPVMTRPNYHLLVGHKVTEVISQESGDEARKWKTAGVKIQAIDSKDAPLTDVQSKREVILAAGAIHTPGILQRSGIGPSDVLIAAKVGVKVELPGVGQNFQDHALLNIFYNLAKPPHGPDQMFMNRTLMQEAQREYATNKTGPLTLSGGNSGAFLPLTFLTNSTAAILSAIANQSPANYLPPNTHPTVVEGYGRQLAALKSLLGSDNAAAFEYPIGYGNMIAFLKPLSRGTVNIDPKDPLAEPLVNYRTFTNPLDITLSIHGAKILRQLYSTPSARALGPSEQSPGSSVQTDAQWTTWLKRSMSPSFYHPVGTASLGPVERGGAVGPDLKVHGVQGLRVVDASVMPLIPGTHTSSTVYAVAEKAAEMIITSG
ncbi:choline dehydrogenase [Pyrenochaeta sp. MPI-SDFR-AT-0127]|nr:choline dehydrogenase [Pyrenochaeta sp. MPI-SDFR-AT-0127]